MFLSQLLDVLSGIVYLLLHVTGSGTFPKALSAAEEKKYLEEMGGKELTGHQSVSFCCHVI